MSIPPKESIYLVGGCYLLDQNMNVNYMENNRIRSTRRVIYDRAKYGIWISLRGEGFPTFHTEFSANKSEKFLLHKSMAIGVT